MTMKTKLLLKDVDEITSIKTEVYTSLGNGTTAATEEKEIKVKSSKNKLAFMAINIYQTNE